MDEQTAFIFIGVFLQGAGMISIAWAFHSSAFKKAEVQIE